MSKPSPSLKPDLLAEVRAVMSVRSVKEHKERVPPTAARRAPKKDIRKAARKPG